MQMTRFHKWLVILAVLVTSQTLLVLVYPFVAASAVIVSIVAPVIATLFFGFLTGAVITGISWGMSGTILLRLTNISTTEGVLRLPVPVIVTLALCFGADRLRHYFGQRKRVEEDLKASEQKYRLIFDHSGDGIILLDGRGTILDASPRVETHTGLSPAGILGKRFLEIGVFDPIAQDEIAAVLESVSSFDTTEMEVLGKKSDGAPHYLQLTLSRIAEHSSRVRWLCSLKNTTERREMMAKLHEGQKMRAIGRLAGGVAHDINNILNAILGSAHAHQHELVHLNRGFEDLDNIIAACNRGAKLTQNLLGFARKSTAKKEIFSFNTAIERVLSIVDRTGLKHLHYEMQLEENLPPVYGDQLQIENALMNICLNAQDAMQSGGRLRVETRSNDTDVWVRVVDNGCGMDEETRLRAFEPFFTTKPVGKGTGLGLSMVYGVTQQHNGVVDIASTLGEGTQVTLRFPKAPVNLPFERTTPIPKPAEKGSTTVLFKKTVLLVDDEPLVLRAGTRMLASLGCRVLSARSGEEALALYRQHADTVTLVILDLIMPEMDGISTLEQLKTRNPNLPVLLASGYSQEMERVSELKEMVACGFLAKPYHPDTLIAAAKTVLEAAA